MASNSDCTSYKLRVIKLLRVSSDEQKDGGGLDAQDRVIDKGLEDLDEEVEIAYEFSEEGISGTTFPRATLIEILKIARTKDVDVLAVKDVSRIGRITGPTFGFIWMLNARFDVNILTEDGLFDITRKPDLIQMFFDALNAELKNRFRSSYVFDSQIENFRQGKFHVTGRSARFGYRKTLREEVRGQENQEHKIDQDERLKEGEDLEVDTDEAEVMERIFSLTTEIGPVRHLFANIREELNKEFNQDRLPAEDADLKALLRDPIYRGEPTWEVDLSSQDMKSATMDRPDLAIVDEDTFKKVNKILRTRERKYYRSDDEEDQSTSDRVSVQQLASTIGLSRLVAFDDIVRIHCPDCGEEMQDNGSWRATSDIRPPNVPDVPEEPLLKRYRCPNEDCERHEKRFPNEFEGYMLFNDDISLNNLVQQV